MIGSAAEAAKEGVCVCQDSWPWYEQKVSVGPEVVTPAYVLHGRAYGESDRIVTFLTALAGKITGIAKGAKNSRRRFGGTLEPFVLVRLAYRPRSGSDLVFLERCELMEAHRAFREDLDRYAAGTYVLELVDRLVLGAEPGSDVYRLLDDALRGLEAGPVDPILRAFELHLLARSGYAPSLEACRGCSRPLDDHSGAYLCVERGGLLCRACIRPGERVRPIHPATAAALGRLAAGPLADAATLPASILAEAAIVSEHLLAAVTPTPLRSRAFLARTRVDSRTSVR
jgi:DNA repair protein RecO (recombination protein O)